MSKLDSLNSLVEAAIETQTVDMTEISTGMERITLPAGEYNCRMMKYIEVGKRLSVFNGKPTGQPPQLHVIIGFEFYTQHGDIMLTTFPTKISNHEKSTLKKLFDRLNVKGDIKHFAQSLGRSYRMEVSLEEVGGKKYNRMKFETLKPLPKFDPDSGEPITLPELGEDKLQLFLWNKPTQETWDSLFIGGTNDKGESKNYLQETILQAVDYEGAPLQQLLEGEIAASAANTASTVSEQVVKPPVVTTIVAAPPAE